MDETHSANRFKKLHLEEYRPPRRVRNFFHYNRTSVVPIPEDGSCLVRESRFFPTSFPHPSLTFFFFFY